MLKILTTRFALALAALFMALSPALADGLPGPLAPPSWLADNLGRDDLVVIDIRGTTADDYAAGHVPGAVWSAYPGAWRGAGAVPGSVPETADLQATIAALGANDTSLVVIVSAGSGAVDFGGAARVYWSFKYAGHDEVAILDGGWAAWVADALRPVSTDAVTPAPGNFVAQVRPELLATTDEVVAALDGSATLIDARSAAQYSGAQGGAAGAAGHIPGALNLEHATLFDPAANRLKPLDDLRALMPAELADPSEPVIAYCMAGHLSATDWFVMHELMGLTNAALYVDSITGWTQDPARPLATN
ncbi:sulfurtransferase [Phaeovulum sp.]|uniref:sulfurtransferase n=1 Tax=Phaeovulum sp. TaxID=2934796 RepID=UPI0035632D82